MSIVAQFSVPAEAFDLGGVLDVEPDVTVRMEPIVPTGGEVVPYLWISSDEVAPVESALADSPLVDEVDVVSEANGETLFRVEWSTEVDGFLDSLRTASVVVLEAVGRGDAWNFSLRFPNHTGLSTFYRSCIADDVDLELDDFTDPPGTKPHSSSDLSSLQVEALRAALDHGYYDVPRRITLEQLAEKLGISDTALSQRLRRGTTKVLVETIGTGNPGSSGDDADG